MLTLDSPYVKRFSGLTEPLSAAVCKPLELNLDQLRVGKGGQLMEILT